MKPLWGTIGPLVVVLAAGCSPAPAPLPTPPTLVGVDLTAPFDWDLPPGYPTPLVPADNPMTTAGVLLGRHLFYDRRLSGNETQSCASCHDQALAFADPRPLPVGSTGDVVPRNAPALTNSAYYSTLTWASPSLVEFEQQVLIPMFSEEPIELGITGLDDVVLERFRSDPTYQVLFPAAFPDADDAITFDHIVKALSSFLRTMIAGHSPWDRATYGNEPDAVGDAVRRGAELFFGERLECHHCHGGFNFTQAVRFEGTAFVETAFHNTGLYNLDGRGAYPATNTGLFEFTGDPQDMGRFRAPSLHNVALTAPYFHDGSAATLDEVLRIYEAGGRETASGPLAGDGRNSPLKSGFLRGFTLTDQERADLLAFLEALTDPVFVSDPRFADPFATPSSTP